MSEVYPVDDLVWNNKSTGAELRPRLLQLKLLSIDELTDLYQSLDELGLGDQQPISDVIGVVFAADSVWNSLRVGELKAMLALATGNLDGAAQWCQWCHSLEFLPAPRQQLYRVIHDLIDFDLAGENPAGYLSSLKQFFGDQTVSLAQQIVSGTLTFYGLNFDGSWERISPAHDNLLNIYKKLHLLK